jgi:menaquinone-dependent protoporphyrinogen oxidase
MTRIALLYDTTEGQTAKIAERIAETLSRAGVEVTLASVREVVNTFRVEAYDAVILGASVHVGKHAPLVSMFVEQHREALAIRVSAFFSVSLSAAGKSQRQQADARRCLETFLKQTAWQPQQTATFAGALRYRDYGFFKRWMMKKIASREGGDTDTSKNHEYTDWKQVETSTVDFLRLVETERERQV